MVALAAVPSVPPAEMTLSGFASTTGYQQKSFQLETTNAKAWEVVTLRVPLASVASPLAAICVPVLPQRLDLVECPVRWRA